MRRQAWKLAALGAVVTALLSACSSGPDWTPPAEEPAHRVTYLISTVGTANEDLAISYTDETGADAKASTPGFAGLWSKTITTAPGVVFVGLGASAYSSDLAFKITCTIEVDGVKTDRRGPYACTHSVDLPSFRSAHPTPPAGSPTRSPSPSPTPSPAATAARTPAPRPAACRYVTEAEATSIVAANARGTIKPVLSVGGDDTRCTYVFEYQTGQITFSWTPGGRTSPPLPNSRVSEIDVPAYWTDLGMFTNLQVQLPKGLFKVEESFTGAGLEIDQKAAAIEFFKVARPRLP